MRLELCHVTAGYGGTIALRDVDLTVPDGKVVALLGPNGAGKTTLLRVASKLIDVRGGSLLLDREDVTSVGVEALANLGVCHITEGRAVFRELSVRENLRLFCLKGDEEAGIERAVAAFPRLGERLGQSAGTMSGGEQQMLALARAYARPVSVVLLDEPSMGLAPIVVDEIFETVRSLAADGVSVLLVEQYVAKALAVADLVYVLDRGRIAFVGEPGEADEMDVVARYMGAETVGAS
jgi:branched-chain amino acid transport system ATP-binding protein